MPLNMSNQWVTIAQRALARIGNTTISSLDQGTPPANYAQTLLPEAVQSVYDQFDWKSSIKRVQLSQLTTVPLYEWDYAYQLPNDFARLIGTSSSNAYSIENETLLSDDEELYITYIAYPLEATDIPGHLSHLLVTYLAFLLSTPLTSNESTTQRLLAEYNMALEQAKRDANAGVYEEPGTDWYGDLR